MLSFLREKTISVTWSAWKTEPSISVQLKRLFTVICLRRSGISISCTRTYILKFWITVRQIRGMQRSQVCLLWRLHRTLIEKTAHGITARYESIIGFGECSFVTEQEEIIHGMKLITEHYGYDEYPIERCAGLSHLFVGKIVLNEIYGKKNLPGSWTPADNLFSK